MKTKLLLLFLSLAALAMLFGCAGETEGKTFDARTEKYLELLDRTETGAALVRFARTNDVTFVWKSIEQGGVRGAVGHEGEVVLASNRLADPSAGPVSDEDLARGAGIIAHELSHVLMGDYTFPEPPYPVGTTEPLAQLVEAKFVAEMLVIIEGPPVDYYGVLGYFDEIPAEPWKLADSLDEMGVVPVDPELARRLLWLPEP